MGCLYLVVNDVFFIDSILLTLLSPPADLLAALLHHVGSRRAALLSLLSLHPCQGFVDGVSDEVVKEDHHLGQGQKYLHDHDGNPERG